MNDKFQRINGIDIYWYYLKNMPIKIGIYFKAGGLYQKIGQEGISHLLEHIVISQINRKYVSGIFANKSTSIQGYTTKEHIYFHIRSYDENIFTHIYPKITAQIYSGNISESAIANEIQAITHELSNFRQDYPNTNQIILHDFLALNKSYPQIMGLVEGSTKYLRSINREALKKFLDKHLTKPDSIIVVGGIKPDDKSLKTLVRPYSSVPIQKTISRLTTDFSNRGLEINDKVKKRITNDDLVFAGIGWRFEFISSRNYLEQLLFFKAITDVSSGLYNILRSKHGIVYDLFTDTDVIDKKLSIFSIHTSLDSNNKGLFLNELKEYLANRKLLIHDISQQLEFYKLAVREVADGSSEIFNFLGYFHKTGISIGKYTRLIKRINPENVLNSVRNIQVGQATILFS